MYGEGGITQDSLAGARVQCEAVPPAARPGAAIKRPRSNNYAHSNGIGPVPLFANPLSADYQHGSITHMALPARTKGADRRPALVLGGGGAFGVVQAAYIQAAYELGFRPELVIGTSVGALNGAWVALHPDEPEELLKVWLGLERMKLVDLAPHRLVQRLLRSRMSLCTNEIVPGLIARHLAGLRFEDTALPLGIVATNLSRGMKRLFRAGPLDDAILASTAIPGVFAPVELDGDLFVDGGVVASVDLASAVEMGATEIFAIDLTPAATRATPRTALGVLRQSFGILSAASTTAMEACLARQMPVRVLRPDLSRVSPWKLDDSTASVENNLQLARHALANVFDADGTVMFSAPPLEPEPQHGATRHVAPPERTPAPLPTERYFHRRVKRQAAS